MTRGISIGPGEVAGYLGQLRNGCEALGIPCEHVLYVPAHTFAYPAPNYFLRRAYEASVQLGARGRIGRLLARVADKAIRLVGLTRAILRCDVFIFSGYGSFFRFLELPLLRMLGKRIIVVYLGSDARPPYLSGKHLDDSAEAFDPARIAAETRMLRRMMARVERHASVIVNHTGTAQFSTRPFVRYSHVGMPMPTATAGLPGRSTSDGPLRILHAPSRPIAKGTLRVREAVARLRAEGIAVELVELSGVPNSEVLRQLASCDVVVDELYSDLPLATFGAEAASFAKPAIVGSLYVERFAADNPGTGPAPTIFIHPDDLEVALRRLVTDEEWRIAEGGRAHTFLRARCTPRDVAARYLRLAQGDVPPEWIVDPAQLDYIGGWGLPEAAWRTQLAHYLSVVGEGGLALDHRPQLRARIVDAVEGGAIS